MARKTKSARLVELKIPRIEPQGGHLANWACTHMAEHVDDAVRWNKGWCGVKVATATAILCRRCLRVYQKGWPLVLGFRLVKEADGTRFATEQEILQRIEERRDLAKSLTLTAGQ